uniref:Ribosomal protein S2 n=1 Tax=Imasa heleensis TaxID=2772037 RepID=A0A893DD70_9EUKA|nr:ribosomal protein S2 [Imasa heleensis]QRR29730.1 ribosomal protein S2 [Imasa heleensis]
MKLNTISIKKIFYIGGHLGEVSPKLHQSNYTYIYGIINNISIIDITYTLKHIKNIIYLIYDISLYKGKIYKILNKMEYLPGHFTNKSSSLYDLVLLLIREKKEQILKEASKMLIPSASLADTHENTSDIDYPIIINNSTSTINLLNSIFTRSIRKGSIDSVLLFKYKYIIRD